jgi:hypothetical protein
MPPPNVTLFLEGMILLFFEEGDFINGTAQSCQVGILRDAPGHMYEIKVRKRGTGATEIAVEKVYEEEDLRFTLALEVGNPPDTPIKFHEWDGPENFDRLKSNRSAKSFRWVLDLEREIYSKRDTGIGANRKQFRSILHVNAGTFFTTVPDAETGGLSGISLNDLLICDEQGNPKKFVGRVATRVGVEIKLDAGDTATFFNGNEVLFAATPKDHYVVTVNRIRPTGVVDATHRAMDAAHAASHHSRDANNFYNAIGHELDSAEKVFFVSTSPEERPPAGPEAACLVGVMGVSEI